MVLTELVERCYKSVKRLLRKSKNAKPDVSSIKKQYLTFGPLTLREYINAQYSSDAKSGQGASEELVRLTRMLSSPVKRQSQALTIITEPSWIRMARQQALVEKGAAELMISMINFVQSFTLNNGLVRHLSAVENYELRTIMETVCLGMSIRADRYEFFRLLLGGQRLTGIMNRVTPTGSFIEELL